MVLDNAIGNGKPKPGTLSDRFGGEKWVKNVANCFWGHATAGIRNLDNNFFVCSDVKKNIYQIKVGKNHKEKKLFSLRKKDFVFDKNYWAYNDVASLLCLINKSDRRLHIFDIKKGKSTQYMHHDDFPIVNMMFHPTNKMILTLLSQDRKYIEYVDLSNFAKICPVFATKHKTLGGRGIPDLLMMNQKMAFSCDGERLFVSAGGTIFNIGVPFLIAHQHNLKKYQLIRCLPFSPDLQKLLLWYLLLVRKGKQE